MNKIEKRQIFFQGKYEYDLEFDGQTFSLYYNDGVQWSSHIRGSLAFQIIDDGNGFKITKLAKKDRLDYSEIFYMNVLTTIIQNDKLIEISNKKELGFEKEIFPDDEKITNLVSNFVNNLNVSSITKKNVEFGYQEGLYKMLEIWKNDKN